MTVNSQIGETKLDSIWQKRLLSILRIIVQKFTCQEGILELDANRVMAVSSDLRLRLWLVRILEMARTERWDKGIVLDGCEYLRVLTLSGMNAKPPLLQVINNQPGLSIVLDSDFSRYFHESESATRVAFDQAHSILRTLLPQMADLHLANVQYIVGLDGPADEILAGSSPDFPGMVAFNINTEPLIAAEQLLHEAMHNSLTIKLESDNKYKDIIFNLPAGYSLFVEKVRPFELILHGFLSYTAVFLLWNKLKENTAKHLRVPNGYTIQFINQRCKLLQKRLRRTWTTLMNLTPRSFRKTISELTESLVFGACDWLDFLSDNGTENSHIIEADRISVLAQDWGRKYSACQTEWAEFVLAIAGEKVSRISAKLVRAKEICQFFENNHIPYCVSNEVFIPNEDLAGFSNTYSEVFDLRYFEDEEGEVNIFISNSIDLAFQAFESDPQDMAGSYLQIPSCCRRFFLMYWKEALDQFNGDLFRKLLSSANESIISLPWQTNVMSLYRGSSLLFHFPCQLYCPETIKLVNHRARLLRSIDSIQVDHIKKNHQSGFFLTADGRYLEKKYSKNTQLEKEIYVNPQI